MSKFLSASHSIVAGGDLATSTPLAYGSREAGRIINNSGAAVTVTVYEADAHDGDYALCDDVGTAGVLPEIADGESLEIPTKLKGSAWLKFVADDTAQPTLTIVTKG